MSMNCTALRRLRRAGRSPRGFMGLGDAGQALIEVAIALPILLALLVGIFEFARAYNVQQVITNAAREGAREGVVAVGTVLQIENSAEARANSRLSDAGISSAALIFSCSGGCTTGTALSITITVPYTFVFIGPVLSLFSSGVDPGTINLSSTSTMRRE